MGDSQKNIELVREAATGQFVPGSNGGARGDKTADTEWHGPFLKLLAKYPNARVCCKELGVSYNTYKYHKKKYPDFADDVEEAKTEGVANLEKVVFNKALDGNLDALKFLLRSLKPEEYRTGTSVTVNNRIDLTLLKRLDFTKLPQNVIDMFTGRLVSEELLRELLSTPEYLLPE